MEDGETWCCNKPYHKLYLEKEGEEVVSTYSTFTVEDIKELPLLGNQERGIRPEIHARFKVRTELSEVDRSPVAIYYPETHEGKFLSYKKRKLPKQFSVVKGERTGTPDFFGQHCSPRSGKAVLICAGEEDTMAAYQMLHDRYPDWDHAVVGLPRGETGSQETVAENLEFLKGFEKVVLCMDMDDAGRKALGIYAPIIGERALTMAFSEKDAGDMLCKNKEKEFINAYFNAKEWRPAHIVAVEDILEESIRPVQWGLSYPWTRLTELTYGLKEKGEIVGIGAAPGAGKSTIWQQIQKHLIFEHQEKIAVFDIEEGASQGLKKLIGSCMNKPIHKPDCDYNIEEARSIGAQLEGACTFLWGR